jgi:hypothetical protein
MKGKTNKLIIWSLFFPLNVEIWTGKKDGHWQFSEVLYG